jgi:hypothetical protein
VHCPFPVVSSVAAAISQVLSCRGHKWCYEQPLAFSTSLTFAALTFCLLRFLSVSELLEGLLQLGFRSVCTLINVKSPSVRYGPGPLVMNAMGYWADEVIVQAQPTFRQYM